MAKTVLDTGDWIKGLDALGGPIKESLARRMLVTGGVHLRDRAKQRVPLSDGPYNDTSRGSNTAGTLRDAIYLAFNEKLSNGTVFTYSVTWNARKAWWGKLVEFGHFMRFAFFRDKDGVYHTIKDRPLAAPIWIPAKPFLAPTFDAELGRVKELMVERGKQELPVLIAEYNGA